MVVLPPSCEITVLLLVELFPVDELSLEILTFNELLELLLEAFTLTELWPVPSCVGTVCWVDPFWGTATFWPFTLSCTLVLLVLAAPEAEGVEEAA